MRRWCSWVMVGVLGWSVDAAAQDRGTGVPTRTNPSGNYTAPSGSPAPKVPLGSRRYLRGYAAGSRAAASKKAVPLEVGEYDPVRAPKGAPSVVRGRGRGADVSLSAPQLVQLLGDPIYSQDGKQRTQKELLEGGMSAMPALINALGDKRVYEETTVQTADGPAVHKVTVAQVAEEMLYEIVTPDYVSPHEKRMVPKSAVMFTVRDWKAWYERNKKRPLEKIHQDIQGVMDSYWKSGGQEQVVE